MGKRGNVSLIEVTPGFDAIRDAVAPALGNRSLTIVAASSSILLRVQEAFVGDDRFADLRAAGVLDLVTVSQLVDKLCATAAIPTLATLDLERQAALIGLCAQQLPSDSAFAGSKHLPGFYEAAAKTLQELRHQRVRIDSIAMPTGKLRDVAILQEGLRDELERRGYGTLSDRIENLIGSQPTRLFDVKRVLWLPCSEWPPLTLELLNWMLLTGIDVDLCAEVHPGAPGFFSATETLREAFPNAKTRRVEGLQTPGAQLFSVEDRGGTSGDLTILEASDDFIEVEWALRECRRRIRDDGFDPKDIVIFARSLESYGPMLRAAADREGLPLSMDYAEQLTAHPFPRFVLGALQSMARPGVGGIVGMVRSAYGQVPSEEREEAEKTVRNLASEPDVWLAVGEAAKDGRLPGWLAAVARWRKIALEGRRKPADWMKGMNQLISDTPWLEASSAREDAAKDSMVRSMLVALLALDPHSAVPFDVFLEFAERTWSAAEYRVRTQGGVRVVSDPTAIGNAKAVIAVGVIEGRFPSRRAEDPVLLDRDRAALNAMDSLWGLADSYARAREDDRDFYRLLCSSADLTLCFPASVGENAQERAAYLWDIADFVGVRQETRTFSQRFPRLEECTTERDVLASLIWHGEKDFEPMDSISNRLTSLRSAHEESQKTTLTDDILRAKLANPPHPVNLAHLRSLDQCPFQYFARHRLGIRSRQGDPLNRVIVNAIRRSNFNASDEQTFTESLLKGLESELLSLQGVLTEHEIQVVRCSAPTSLEQFAKIEMGARRMWNLTPIHIAPQDDQSGLRRTAKVGDVSITLSPSIDVVYRREPAGEIVPMRIGWEADDTQSKQENYLVMMMHPGDPKFAMFDAYNHSRRTLYCRRDGDRKEKLPFRGNLAIDIGPKSMREIGHETKRWMKELMDKARSGNPVATPSSQACDRCDLGSFCRAAPFADPLVDWRLTTEEEEAQA